MAIVKSIQRKQLLYLLVREVNVNLNDVRVPKTKNNIPLLNGKLGLNDVQKFDINNRWELLARMGNLNGNMEIRLGPYNDIKDCWKDEPAFIVGASKSLEGFDLTRLDGLHTIGINHMVEYYDKYEYLIFLDDEFLKRTTYNLENFKGRIFSSHKCRFIDYPNVTRFLVKAFKDKVTLNIEDGLFNGAQTGLCALNLALITGANPIYLLGCDSDSKCTSNNYHYGNYTGEVKSETKLKKYYGAYGYYNYFKDHKDRVVNVCPGGKIDLFKKIDYNELDIVLSQTKKKERKEFKFEIKQNPIICHVMKLKSMNEMGDISRQVFNLTDGQHITSSIDNPVQPKANIYFLECMINGNREFIHFQKPKGSKVISLIHSHGNCLPAICSDKVVTITDASKKYIKTRGFDSVVIPASIDLSDYKHEIDYNNKNYGRITRYSTGKIHPFWNKVVENIKNKVPGSKCIMITRIPDNQKSNYIEYIQNININEHDKKAKELSRFSIFADMHNTFIETFSLGLLEGMASGQAVVLYSAAPQPAMIEVLGNTGIVCESIQSFENNIIKLLNNPCLKKEIGLKCKERAKYFSIDKMIKSYNALFEEILK